MNDPTSGLAGASDDDPLLRLDARGRVSLGQLAPYRRYYATVTEGQILLTPAVAVSDRDPLVHRLPALLAQISGVDPPPLLEMDGRGRLSLGKLTGGHRRYLATTHPTGQITLTRATIIAATDPLFTQLELAARSGQRRGRPDRSGRPAPAG